VTWAGIGGLRAPIVGLPPTLGVVVGLSLIASRLS
jgi:hypothetical protein